MATYLKRTSKLFDLSVTRSGSTEVSLRDLICPICRGILIEPVTLPCTHNLCLGCLKGTFERKSLSCPLCRLRVGSWLRSATKSETLVNSELWNLIRTRFSKEVEGKHGADKADGRVDSGFETRKKILNAAGEIRREYEVQIQMAQKEMRRQREAERLASETLIRKIQDEEQRHQYDQTLDKSEKKDAKRYEEYYSSKIASRAYFDAPKLQSKLLDNQKARVKDQTINDIRKSNSALISKMRTERYKEQTELCQKPAPIHNAVTQVLTYQPKYGSNSTSSGVIEPSCSMSNIYGLQTKEELHVPSDVLNNKKKKLGIEVCVTNIPGEERIGSAESAGSHDSINQEIHHFKPIKAMPRTPLRVALDGRQVDPKLVRVIPVLKKVSNAVPKPPSLTFYKKMLGCSWSAFKGKTRQKESASLEAVEEVDEKPIVDTKPIKPEPVRRLDLPPEISFDSNKNYAKSINRIINGTKVSKKLNLDEDKEAKNNKVTKNQPKNGLLSKHKLPKDPADLIDNKVVDEADPLSPKVNYELFEAPMENIAERIKRRKTNCEPPKKIEVQETPKKAVKKKQKAKSQVKVSQNVADKIKGKKARKVTKRHPWSDSESEESNSQPSPQRAKKRKIRAKSVSSESRGSDTDEEAAKNQERMQNLLDQEKEDFELARQLQAQFDAMEKIARRTRHSRRIFDDVQVPEMVMVEGRRRPRK